MMETSSHSVPAALQLFAASMGADVQNNRLEIPQQFGRGYCAGYTFNEQIRMVIMDYELKDDIVIERPESGVPGSMLLFKFRNFTTAAPRFPAARAIDNRPAVLITTSRMTADGITIHSNRATINIEVDAGYLSRQLIAVNPSAALQGLLQNTEALLFDQLAPDNLQRIIDEMLSGSVPEDFKLFHLRIKAEELICRLLMLLEARGEQALSALNARDIQALYSVRAQMLERLEIPPVIKALSTHAGMSPTKLKRLFRQVFGNSIFSYYQEFRMREAARLLRDERLSVSETGYRLGFSNLSHFTRVFEAHTGIKPKRYSTMQFPEQKVDNPARSHSR